MNETYNHTLISTELPNVADELGAKLTKADIPYEIEERQINSSFSIGREWFLVNVAEEDKEAAEAILHGSSKIEDLLSIELEEPAASNVKAWQNVAIGLVLLMAGIAFTAFTLTNEIEFAVVSYGAMLTGGIMLLRGIVQLRQNY